MIAGFLVIGVAAAAWAAKIVNVGGGLILGGLVAAAFVSLWYFFQNLDDEESRKVYGAASILSIGILASLVNFVWGDQLAEFIPGGLERKEQIFWTLWYLFVLVMMMIGTIRCIRRQRQKKRKEMQNRSFHGNYGDDHVCNTVAVSEHHAEPVQKHRNLERRTAVRRGAAEKKQNLENDWLIGDESWREGNKILSKFALPITLMPMTQKRDVKANISTRFILMMLTATSSNQKAYQRKRLFSRKINKK